MYYLISIDEKDLPATPHHRRTGVDFGAINLEDTARRTAFFIERETKTASWPRHTSAARLSGRYANERRR
jgi:hypothetical protein